ncbi:HMG-box [Lophiostoma macrostomum CBS 122681]|uniref:HMG-box n=1 Tax=Lophiostoma macrostomum CBS 122681 TaxID=1314788 RepID=A0A6A6TLQ4_9PLEO|nr:HMG-box [Lophiostoma macrostomum CBS 122681]
MSDLSARLERLGLSQYLDAFVAEGFDTWETLLDITESDLAAANVRLGHRRKLQRALGQLRDEPSPKALGRQESTYDGDASSSAGASTRVIAGTSSSSSGTAVTKRKYRRHPKPDENAPERPPTAYVVFSIQVRESLRGQDLSFTELAKEAGERWQHLSVEAREQYERQADMEREKYYAELAAYKQTPEYQKYLIYLEDFKAKYRVPQQGKE